MSEKQYEMYGLNWPRTIDPVKREIEMVRHGGQWRARSGATVGEGMFFHFKKLQELLWPEKIWHRWAVKELECYLQYKYIGEMGCASAGKSESAASNVLTDWYCWPECTSVIVSSTTIKSLRIRIFGCIKRYHKLAKERCPWIPGHLIEGENVILNDPKKDSVFGREFKNGILGTPCKRGESYVGLAEYVGIHNKRVRLICEELQFLPRAFIDSTSNLAKCPDFKCVGNGNPSDITNALGMLCEPAAHLGGWDAGLDQMPGTKTWETRFPNGICLQLPGSDSPNMDVPEGEPPPYPFLITREQMADDAKVWGTNDWHYTMMNEARMPRGQAGRRIITRQMCDKFGARDEPNWLNSQRIRIGFCDSAFNGGDRCVFGEAQVGEETPPLTNPSNSTSIVSQTVERVKGRKIFALIDTVVVPISAEKGSDLPEDQIVQFVIAECERRHIPPENFFFDAGMKSGLVQAFSRLWSNKVNTVDFGGRPSERKVSADIDVLCKDYYSKFVTEMWYSVRLTIEASQFRGMTEEAMMEFCAREWKKVSGNKVEAESKEDMRLKTGRSPDLADGVAIGLEGARRLGFEIARLASDKRRTTDDQWKRDLKAKAQALIRSKELTYS